MPNKDEMIDAISKMSVIELSELVKAIEEKFGPRGGRSGPRRRSRLRRRGEDGFHRRSGQRPGGQEDRGHQGRARDHRTGAEGSQGSRGGRAQERQGRRSQSPGGGAQEEALRRWSDRRDQVGGIPPAGPGRPRLPESEMFYNDCKAPMTGFAVIALRDVV